MAGAKSRGLAEACQATHRECRAASLVCLVHLVCFVHLVGLVKPNKRDKPNKPNNGLLLPADFFRILLGDW
jgi:hypothetical protein